MLRSRCAAEFAQVVAAADVKVELWEGVCISINAPATP
jgi:hypothetical protein